MKVSVISSNTKAPNFSRRLREEERQDYTRSIKDGRCMMSITITVNGAEHLKSVCEKLKKVKGVLETERSGL